MPVVLVRALVVASMSMTSASVSRAVPVQCLRHQVQEGGAARGGDSGHGPSRRVRLRRAAGRAVRAGREAGARRRALLRRGGVPVRRRRRRGRRGRGAVPRVAAERRRAGAGAGARVRGLAGAGGPVPVQLAWVG
jgi:hypothetical protein